MTLVDATRRLPLVVPSEAEPLEQYSGDDLLLGQNLTSTLQCTLFNDDPAADTLIDEVDGFVSAKLVVRRNNEQGVILFQTTTSSFNSNLTYSDWLAGISEHFSFGLTTANTNFAVLPSGRLPIYYVITITTTTKNFVAARGTGEIVDMGTGALPYTEPELDTIPVTVDALGVVQNPIVDFRDSSVSINTLTVGNLTVTSGSSLLLPKMVLTPHANPPFTIVTEGTNILSDYNGLHRNATVNLVDGNLTNTNNIMLNMKLHMSHSLTPGIGRTGIAINSYLPVDTGGDTSAILVTSAGGGNCITAYKNSQNASWRPAGEPDLSLGHSDELGGGHGKVVELGMSDQGTCVEIAVGADPTTQRSSQAIAISMSGYKAIVGAGAALNRGTKGIIAMPGGSGPFGSFFDQRPVYEVGMHVHTSHVNSSLRYTVNLAGEEWTSRSTVRGRGQGTTALKTNNEILNTTEEGVATSWSNTLGGSLSVLDYNFSTLGSGGAIFFGGGDIGTELRYAAIKSTLGSIAPVSDPTVAPSVSASGSGSTLLAGTYLVGYTWISAAGETRLSPTSSVTIIAGQHIVVGVIALPSFVSSVGYYISPYPGGLLPGRHSTGSGVSHDISTPTPWPTSPPPQYNQASFGAGDLAVCLRKNSLDGTLTETARFKNNGDFSIIGRLLGSTGTGASVQNTANISIPNATIKGLSFNTVLKDTDDFYSTVATVGRFTFTTARMVTVHAHIRFAQNAIGIRQVRILQQPGDRILVLEPKVAVVNDATDVNAETLANVAANDWLEVAVWQNCGDPLNVEYNTTFSPIFQFACLA